MTTMLRIHDIPPRPAISKGSPKWREVHLYQADAELVDAIEMAVFLGQPLLLTGEPGVGKTMAAYWAAWRLGIAPGDQGDLIVEQIRSDATAARLRYEFDAVAYFRESQLAATRQESFDSVRRRFLREGPLWKAFAGSRTRPMALLLDEIDKAPRDLPNDLLHEFDEKRFTVPELPDDHDDHLIDANMGEGSLRLIVFTSNGERQLPEAFLRRCIHHHIAFEPEQVRRVLQFRMANGDLSIPKGMVDLALRRFLEIRVLAGLKHRPGLAELIVWLRVLEAGAGVQGASKLEAAPLGELPYLGALLKEPQDHAIARQRR